MLKLYTDKACRISRGRGAWRDYVDIYWGLNHGLINLKDLIKETQKRFQGVFSEKLFLEQLTYFGDINDWAIDWVGENISTEEVKKFLSESVKKYLLS